MIIKASKVKSIRHAGMLATHLQRTDENEIAQIWAIDGTARPDDLDASLRSMQRATELTRGKTGLFHVAINPRDHEADQMTPEQWERTLQAIEEEFNLEGQPRAIIEHRKNGRSHLHAVYQLTDTEEKKLIDVKNDHYRCQSLGRKLEKEFEHELTNNEPSNDAYSRDEQQQAKRLGQDVIERRAELRDDFKQADNLKAFQELLAAKGYTIAKGDKAAVVLVDDKGEVYGLTRELGIKAKELRLFLGDELQRLPTVAEVIAHPKLELEPQHNEAAVTVDGRDLADSQDLAFAMLKHFKKEQPAEGISYSFTVNQVLKTPSEMLYSDLIKAQLADYNKMYNDFLQARKELQELQEYHFTPELLDVEIQRLTEAFERDEQVLKEQHELERQEFLGEAPTLSNDKEPVKDLSVVLDEVTEIQDNAPAVVRDELSESQDRAADLLAEQRAKKQQQDDDDPLKQFRYNPEDDVLKEFRAEQQIQDEKEIEDDDDPLKAFRYNPEDDVLAAFRYDSDEQTKKRTRGLGLG